MVAALMERRPQLMVSAVGGMPSTDIKTGYVSLVEIRQVEDFEGVVQLALGVSGETCYRAFILNSPTRLVIDIQAA